MLLFEARRHDGFESIDNLGAATEPRFQFSRNAAVQRPHRVAEWQELAQDSIVFRAAIRHIIMEVLNQGNLALEILYDFQRQKQVRRAIAICVNHIRDEPHRLQGCGHALISANGPCHIQTQDPATFVGQAPGEECGPRHGPAIITSRLRLQVGRPRRLAVVHDEQVGQSGGVILVEVPQQNSSDAMSQRDALHRHHQYLRISAQRRTKPQINPLPMKLGSSGRIATNMKKTIQNILEIFRAEAAINRDLGDEFERLVASYLSKDRIYPPSLAPLPG